MKTQFNTLLTWFIKAKESIPENEIFFDDYNQEYQQQQKNKQSLDQLDQAFIRSQIIRSILENISDLEKSEISNLVKLAFYSDGTKYRTNNYYSKKGPELLKIIKIKTSSKKFSDKIDKLFEEYENNRGNPKLFKDRKEYLDFSHQTGAALRFCYRIAKNLGLFNPWTL